MYAVTLTVGESIQGRKVKENTIRGYLRAAAMYVKSVGMRTDCPMTDPSTGKLFAPIEQCLRDFKRWEAMPKRRSPLTKKMVRDLLAFCKDFPPDSKEKAFADWCIIGLHMGYRRCEWAAEKAPKHSRDFPRADDPAKSIYQVLLDDIRLIGTGGERIAAELAYPASRLQAVKIRVRFQKNGDNGQELTEAANHLDPQLCCARAAQRVKQRAARLGLEGQDPASAYRANKGSKKASFFHSGLIKTLLRNMAKRTYHSVDLGADNLLFTGHSFRVGAAVLLHAGGADGKDIQTRLRWKSDTFLMYLRDVPQIALNHIRMLNLADVENWE
jgi:integrase